jgi:hypothetical protein
MSAKGQLRFVSTTVRLTNSRLTGICGRTDIPTFPTVVVVSEELDTGGTANTLTCRTFADSCRTACTGSTVVSAFAAVGGIGVGVHTLATTKRLATGTATNSRVADLTAGAFVSTGTAVCNIRGQGDTLAGTIGLTGVTDDSAGTADTELAGSADNATFSAVFPIKLCIDTTARTRSQTARTLAGACLTGRAAGADFATATTVVVVAVCGFADTGTTGRASSADFAASTAVISVIEKADTLAIAVGLTSRTTLKLANTSSANFVGFADGSTTTAVAVVSLLVDALAGAKALTRWTLTDAVVTALTCRAFCSTTATVEVVALCIDALATAIGLSGRTVDLANPRRAELTGSTDNSTLSAVGAIGLFINTLTRTERGARRTGTDANLTRTASLADNPALTTVIVVCFRIDTFSTAGNLCCRTTDFADSSKTIGACRTGFSAGSTVGSVVLQILANSTTGSLA